MGLLDLIKRIFNTQKVPVIRFPDPVLTPLPMPQTYLEMNPITLELLKKIDPHVINNAQTRALIPFLNETLRDYEINTKKRVAMFLAQILHESGHLVYLREIWGPTEAQKRYEGRRDLGNTQPGDGRRYSGKGLIQTTGRNNYALLSKEMGVDFVLHPEWLELPKYAAYSAGAFWGRNNLNHLADMGAIEGVTRRVNGGLNGFAERKEIYGNALAYLPD